VGDERAHGWNEGSLAQEQSSTARERWRSWVALIGSDPSAREKFPDLEDANFDAGAVSGSERMRERSLVHSSHAQPGPLRQTLSRAMQLSPHALPLLHTRQHSSARGARAGSVAWILVGADAIRGMRLNRGSPASTSAAMMPMDFNIVFSPMTSVSLGTGRTQVTGVSRRATSGEREAHRERRARSLST
jgi:hypothetical protein